MANKKLVVDFSLLSSNCKTFKNKIGVLEEHINYLKNNGKFLSSEWNADGATTFNKAINEQVANLEALKTTLDNMHTYLTRKASEYQSLDGLK